MVCYLFIGCEPALAVGTMCSAPLKKLGRDFLEAFSCRESRVRKRNLALLVLSSHIRFAIKMKSDIDTPLD
jgi:hypothetical protein